jgi:hypothetical protein
MVSDTVRLHGDTCIGTSTGFRNGVSLFYYLLTDAKVEYVLDIWVPVFFEMYVMIEQIGDGWWQYVESGILCRCSSPMDIGYGRSAHCPRSDVDESKPVESKFDMDTRVEGKKGAMIKGSLRAC